MDSGSHEFGAPAETLPKVERNLEEEGRIADILIAKVSAATGVEAAKSIEAYHTKTEYEKTGDLSLLSPSYITMFQMGEENWESFEIAFGNFGYGTELRVHRTYETTDEDEIHQDEVAFVLDNEGNRVVSGLSISLGGIADGHSSVRSIEIDELESQEVYDGILAMLSNTVDQLDNLAGVFQEVE